MLTDLAVYERGTARFKLLRSEESWNTLLTRQFAARFVPSYAGSREWRSGGMPLPSITAPRWCGSPPWMTQRRRRSLALFFPDDGTWNVNWSPISSDTVLSCQWGAGAVDQPIAGLDRNDDMRSDMAVFRAQSYDDPGSIFTRLSAPTTCDGSIHNVYCSWCPRMRRRVWAVSDMTGDGEAEILMLDPLPLPAKRFDVPAPTWRATRPLARKVRAWGEAGRARRRPGTPARSMIDACRLAGRGRARGTR
jgi:hypothetical protein